MNLHALILAVIVAHAADAPEKYALCRENPKLERAGFVVAFTPEGKSSVVKTVEFDHCAVAGREKDRPMEVQRIYRSKDGQGLCLATQMGSLITSVRLCPWQGMADSGSGIWDAELGPFFTSDLLSGKVVAAGRLNGEGAVTLQALKAPPAAR